ncbi:MAG: hypothetical protein EB010_14480 [Acidimicrobiia bacterium]|nr:hypothetical protein [Acidimicrobiia bacterium]
MSWVPESPLDDEPEEPDELEFESLSESDPPEPRALEATTTTTTARSHHRFFFQKGLSSFARALAAFASAFASRAASVITSSLTVRM